MGIQDLQEFIETHCQQACKPVDLVELSRGVSSSKSARRRGGRLRLVVDVDSCLDRLYGGFYSDWACGGEWARMIIFLSNLFKTCHAANLDLLVYVNGAMERERRMEWYGRQLKIRNNAHKVLKHVHHKSTPPPKVWWIAPACMETSLRMALRGLCVPMASSMDDHHQEVIAFCRENNYSGIIGHDADYAVFDPPRYFSAHNLKLTYKGSLETQEYVIDDVAKAVDLNPKRFSVLAALLGTHLLPVEDLQDFYCMICEQEFPAQVAKLQPGIVVRAVINYVRGIKSVEDLDELGMQVFRTSLGNVADKIDRFRQSVHYYLNGTKDGFLKYFPKNKQVSEVSSAVQPGSYQAKGNKRNKKKEVVEKPEKKEATDEEVSGFSADSIYTDIRSGYGEGSESHTDDNKPQTTPDIADSTESSHSTTQENIVLEVGVAEGALAEQLAELSLSSEEQSDIIAVKDEASSSTQASKSDKPKATNVSKAKKQSNTRKEHKCPNVPQQVLQVAAERHHKGLMHPYIYQILSQGEIKLGQGLEDENDPQLPYSIDVFRLMRQHVYAILFDLSKQLAEYNRKRKDKNNEKKLERPKVSVREWVMPKLLTLGGPRCDTVQAEPVDWLVSGIQRLWLGPTADDKNRRLRAFMSCLHCDLPHNLLMNTSYVHQNLLLMCCVLRYIILYKGQRILRRHELDAFLATAVSPLLHDPERVQEMKLPKVEPRALQLASLFMSGVDHAIFVNDAVGAPIPWNCCSPWLFFDGKLFHFKYLKASNHASLMELSDGFNDQAMRIEQMRKAILQGYSSEMVFARPHGPFMQQQHQQPRTPMYGDINFIPAGAPVGAGRGRGYAAQQMSHGRGIGRGRGLLGQGPSERRGGQLQIAGVVVGNWGANRQHHQSQHQPQHQSQHRLHTGYHDMMGSGDGRRKGRGKGPPPHICNVIGDDQRRGSRGIVSTRARGSGPRSYQVPANQFYNGGQNKNRGRRTGSQSAGYGGHDMTQITLEERTRGHSGGRGRGSTIESPQDDASVSLLSSTSPDNLVQPEPDDNSIFTDAQQRESPVPPVIIMSAKTIPTDKLRDSLPPPLNGLDEQESP